MLECQAEKSLPLDDRTMSQWLESSFWPGQGWVGMRRGSSSKGISIEKKMCARKHTHTQIHTWWERGWNALGQIHLWTEQKQSMAVFVCGCRYHSHCESPPRCHCCCRPPCRRLSLKVVDPVYEPLVGDLFACLLAGSSGERTARLGVFCGGSPRGECGVKSRKVTQPALVASPTWATVTLALQIKCIPIELRRTWAWLGMRSRFNRIDNIKPKRAIQFVNMLMKFQRRISINWHLTR